MCCGEAKIPTKPVIRLVNGFAMGAYIFTAVSAAYGVVGGFLAAETIGIALAVTSLAVLGLCITALVLNNMTYTAWQSKRADPSIELGRGRPMAYIVVGIILVSLMVLNGLLYFFSGATGIVLGLIYLGLSAMVIWDIVHKFFYRIVGLPYPDGQGDVENSEAKPRSAAPTATPVVAPETAPTTVPAATPTTQPAATPAAMPQQPPVYDQPGAYKSAGVSQQAGSTVSGQSTTAGNWMAVTVEGKGTMYRNVVTNEQLPLPPGFLAAQDPRSNRMYFIDNNTKTTSFDFPELQARTAAGGQPF